MAFRGCHRVAANGNGHRSRANAPGQRGMFFASNVMYFVYRLKNYARKTTNQRVAKKCSTYYVPYVSFVSKSACNQNPAMNPAMNPPPNQASRQIVLPNYQGILVRPIGVVSDQKNGVGGPLASGTKLLGKMQNTLTNENLNFKA